MKKKYFVIGYIIVIFVTIGFAVWSINNILKDETLSDELIFQALPIYLGIVSFFTKYLTDLFKSENDNKKYWFNKYILDALIQKNTKLFDNISRLYAKTLEIKKSIIKEDSTISKYKEETASKYASIVEEFTLYWGECVSSLDFIKIYDASLYKKLNDIYEIVQDKFTKVVDFEARTLEYNNNSFCVELEELKMEVLKLLYEACIK